MDYVLKNYMQEHPPEVFCEKDVYKNSANFTGKHLCWSLFFNKPATLLKRDSNTPVFSCEIFCKIVN